MKKTIVFATNNSNKVREFNEILTSYSLPFDIRSLAQMEIDVDIVEDGSSMEQNAKIKSQYIFDNYNYNVLGEDTGLEVEALNGEPGVLTARYAGEEKNAINNMNKLLSNLNNKTNRKARFKTIISLILDGNEYQFEGIVNGTISHKMSGDGGFGYDPVFIPEGFSKTFGELPSNVKQNISHRAKAVQKLINFLKQL